MEKIEQEHIGRAQKKKGQRRIQELEYSGGLSGQGQQLLAQTGGQKEDGREDVVVSDIALEVIRNPGKNEQVGNEPEKGAGEGIAAAVGAALEQAAVLRQQDGTQQEHETADQPKTGDMVQWVQGGLENGCKQQQENQGDTEEYASAAQQLGTGGMGDVDGMQEKDLHDDKNVNL